MNLKTDLYIGIRNFRNYRKGGLSLRTFLGSVMSIGLAMIPIIVVLEVSSGMIEGITRRYVEVSSFHLKAGTYSDYTEENDDSLLTELKKAEGVERVIPFIEGQGLVYSAEGRTGVQLRGVETEIYHGDPGFRNFFEILDGNFDFGDDRRGLLISRTIADELGAEVGDPVKLLISRTSSRGGRPILKPGNYRLTGIFTTGYHELDSFTIYMDISRAERIFGKEGNMGIGLKTDDYTGSLEEVRAAVGRILPDSWYVVPWYDQERALYRNLETTRTMLLFIMGIIIIVAAVNISSSMLNLVMEKQEQIAVLKSMGTSPGSIRIQFLISGFCTGLAGVFLGISLGMLISVNINQVIAFVEQIMNWVLYAGKFMINPGKSSGESGITLLNSEFYLEKIPLKLPLMESLLIGGFTLLASVLASWFPAKKASEILPLDVIRRHG